MRPAARDRQAATDCGGQRAGHNGGEQQARNSGGDNDFPNERWFYCTRHRWLKVEARGFASGFNRSKPCATRDPFVVIQNGAVLFVIHAYSIGQARTLVAARLADKTGIRIVAQGSLR